MLIRAPDVVIGVGMSEGISASQHALNGLFRRLVQGDRPLARLVLAARDVQHAFAGRALDVPDLFEIDVLSAYVLHLHPSHGSVSGENRGAVDMLPLGIAGCRVE